MARAARLLIPNAFYHIINRGIRKGNIFLEERDFKQYLKYLWKYKTKYNAKVYAYCLMPNHIHLILDPSNPDFLKNIMHGINLSYALYFNYKYDTCGHLWQNRYKSPVIQKDGYLLNLMSYIEYNPVRAGICAQAENYIWSSHKARVLGKEDKILDMLDF